MGVDLERGPRAGVLKLGVARVRSGASIGFLMVSPFTGWRVGSIQVAPEGTCSR